MKFSSPPKREKEAGPGLRVKNNQIMTKKRDKGIRRQPRRRLREVTHSVVLEV